MSSGARQGYPTLKGAGGNTVPSFCHMCYNTCHIDARVEGGVIARVAGRKSGVNEGRLCVRGNAGIMHIYDPNRIRTPLKRTNPQKGIGVDPGFVEISWDEALDTIARKLAEVRACNPHLLRIASMDNLRRGPMTAFAQAFGTPHVGPGGGSSGGVSCGDGLHMLGEIIHGSYAENVDYEYCNYLMLWGCSNGFEAFASLTVDAGRCADARARGMKVVVIDPRLSVAAAKADEWVPIRPGTDAALALGMIHVLVNELDLYDASFLKKYTNAPYLVGPDGYYVRGPQSGKPLVWDSQANVARAHDDELMEDYALTGQYEVNGVSCKPAFQLLKERAQEYTPERVAQVTTVPAATTRRLARQWAEEAHIGATITLGGRELPWRPAALNFYRGVLGSKHSTMNALAMETLIMLVGAVDVPGGVVRLDRSLVRAGRPTRLASGPDGLIMPQIYLNFPASVCDYPPKHTDLRDWAPIAAELSHIHYLTALEPEKYGFQGEMVNIIHFCNPIFNMADPNVLAASLRKTFNVVCDIVLSETAQFADIVVPEPSYLERFHAIGAGHQAFAGQSLLQPAVDPLFKLPDFSDVLVDLAERLGILYGPDGMNFWFNQVMGIKPPYHLDLDRKYRYSQVVDQVLKSNSGGERDLEWFRRNGAYFARVGPEKYLPYEGLRIPLYIDLLKTTGDKLRRAFQERDIEGKTGLRWDFSDYDPLPAWKPGLAHQAPPDFDMFAVSYKTILGSFGRGANNAWLMELMERHPYVLKLWMHTDTARRKGLRDGDEVWVESPVNKVRGRVALSEGIHPECVAFASIFGHWAPHTVARGKGSHFNSLCALSLEATDLVSGGLENACARVKVYKAR